ncbi:MAG: protein kinase [Candidatus Moeniiplasma glomeromycotorum]|nr:protein kinase [Candidatus Moeniiplasma glomeromycotorum]MCE8167265.1 protein kinase [Candidatus Moeniiplasma glomeromycotorum]MCE8168722.1 protein kinase [Candidatus Moeniiplasma glomeromycotorum]
MARVIILIGKTGSGKSTLANVISGTSKFKESNSSASVTKDIQVEKFVEDDIKYEIIDTVGIGDTQLKKEEVLDKIAEAVYLARNGISKVLFVTNGRFDQFEMSIYSLLSTIIFDKNVTNYTTIVRTKFPEFEDEEERQKDIEKMMSSEGELSNIIKSCQQRVIHIDNPSLDVDAADDESDDEREEREEMINLRNKTRNKSREKLLEHLQKKCLCPEQKKDYKPQKLQVLNAEIAEHMEEKARKRKELAEKERKRLEKIKIIENSKSDLESFNKEGTEVELIIPVTIEKEWEQINNSQDLENNKSNRKEEIAKLIINTLEHQIKGLKNIKELKEEIQKTDRFIRQKVFRHIFNNLDDIAQITGGNVFINTIIGDNENLLASKLNLIELKKQRKELEKKLLEKRNNEQPLEQIEKEIDRRRKRLVEFKEQLLNYKEVIERWQEQGFTKEQTKEWIKTEVIPYDYRFVGWIRDVKKVDTNWILSNKEEFRDLRNRYNNYGICQKCQQINTSKKWCQPCVEQEWKKDLEQLSGQALINKFIEQQGKDEEREDKLSWIPYEEFTDIEHLADGGFSKIYKAKWGSGYVVLKSLNNSQNIIFEFLTEIANTKLVDDVIDGSVVKCLGISQDPTTKNYLMVMRYMEEGNLRQYLRNKNSWLSLEDKLKKLWYITRGLKDIHNQNLVHQDFHSGNILNGELGSHVSSSISDLGLSRPVNHLKQAGQIFGVLPYVAPEVLRGQPYTQKADIYSFGIIAYELLANAYPYLEMDEMDLTLKVCQGHRPNLDKVPLPQLLKDLIKSCWDSNPNKRPRAGELYNIIDNWTGEIRDKDNTTFYQQYQEIEAEYNTFSQNTPYQIHSNAVLTSKMIDTKQITERLMEYSQSLELNFGELNLDQYLKEWEEESNQNNWTIIHSSFSPRLTNQEGSQDASPDLIQQWQEQNFTFEQCRDWINAGLKPTDYNFCAWLRDEVKISPIEFLNDSSSIEDLKEQFNEHQQQLQTQIEQPPK